MEAREAKSKLKYLGRLKFLHEDSVVKRVYASIRGNDLSTDWTARVAILDRKYGKGTERGSSTTYGEWEIAVSGEVHEHAEALWRTAVNSKRSLGTYRAKPHPSPEFAYDGSFGGGLLFQARTGSLLTGVRQAMFGDFSPVCRLCNESDEDLTHVLFDCPSTGRAPAVLDWRESNFARPLSDVLGLSASEWDPDMLRQILGLWHTSKSVWRRAQVD